MVSCIPRNVIALQVLLIEHDVNTSPFSPAVHACVPHLPWTVTEADLQDPHRYAHVMAMRSIPHLLNLILCLQVALLLIWLLDGMTVHPGQHKALNSTPVAISRLEHICCYLLLMHDFVQ